MLPDWLPSSLSLAGSSYKNDIAALHELFIRDFIDAAPAVIEGYNILVNNRADPAWNHEYTYGFTHMITRGEGDRSIDYDRARKLPWVRAILDNYTRPEVTAFWYSRPKADRLYLWLQEFDFVVILTPLIGKRASSTSDRIIVTAYSIDSGRQYELEKMFKKASIIL